MRWCSKECELGGWSWTLFTVLGIVWKALQVLQQNILHDWSHSLQEHMTHVSTRDSFNEDQVKLTIKHGGDTPQDADHCTSQWSCLAGRFCFRKNMSSIHSIFPHFHFQIRGLPRAIHELAGQYTKMGNTKPKGSLHTHTDSLRCFAGGIGHREHHTYVVQRWLYSTYSHKKSPSVLVHIQWYKKWEHTQIGIMQNNFQTDSFLARKCTLASRFICQ